MGANTHNWLKAEARPLSPSELMQVRQLLSLTALLGSVAVREDAPSEDVRCADAARELGLTARTVQNKARAGEFPGAWRPSTNAQWMIPRSAIVAYKQKRRVEVGR